LLAEEDTLISFTFILVLFCIVRLVGYMTVHPRINFLTATMLTAFDEVIHFFLSFSLTFFMFAVLAHFSFGSSRAQYATLKRSFLTQFQMITAGIDGWGDESFDFILYVLVVYVVQGLFMLNFFLAIVLGAYDVVKQAVVDQVTEQSILADSIDTFQLFIEQRLHRWPLHSAIITQLMKRPETQAVSQEELEGILPDKNRTLTFISRYQRFSFLTNEDVPQQSIRRSRRSGKEATESSTCTDVEVARLQRELTIVLAREEALKAVIERMIERVGESVLTGATPRDGVPASDLGSHGHYSDALPQAESVPDVSVPSNDADRSHFCGLAI